MGTCALLENNLANCEKKEVISTSVEVEQILEDGQVILCDYPFRFIQRLTPDCENGEVIKYYPEKRYNNLHQLPLNPYGQGPFCHFSIDAPSAPGVYLWMAKGELIYIGEAVNLAARFSTGYGRISPRNCFSGGQSTNCKMNKIVMEYYEKCVPIELYFYETMDHKRVELELLHRYHTKYNVKDN